MKKSSKWILGLSFLVIIVGGIIGYKINDTVKGDYVYRGIFVDQVDASCKSEEELVKVLKEEKKNDIEEKAMVLKADGKEYHIPLKDIGFDYEYEQAAKQAYSLGRKGNIFKRYRKIKELEEEEAKLGLDFFYDENKIEEKVKELAGKINREAVDAEFNFNNGDIIIEESQEGYKVKEGELVSMVKDNISALEDISIPLEITEPQYKKEYYSKINGVIGKSSTSFKRSSAGRVNNIKLSTGFFNGKIIHPGDSVSYNSTVGPVNSKSGYQNAPVIVNGELTPGVGGGICQTSTTLYNALLRADLTVTERSHHSIPSNYMEKGLDAVVAGSYLDLKFKNDFDYPVYISARVVNRVVYFDIYGDAENRDYTIQMQTKSTGFIPHKTEKILKKDMKAGSSELVQSGRNGYKVQTYKHRVKDGKIIDTELISSDYYRERKAIYHVGPDKVKKEPEKPEEVEEEKVGNDQEDSTENEPSDDEE